jgi:hypothetical protein
MNLPKILRLRFANTSGGEKDQSPEVLPGLISKVTLF